MKPLGVYIHIPFCVRKCGYCDFVSFAGKENLMQKYIEAVLQEAALYADQFCGHTVDTVYFGGGTPSLLPEEQIAKLLCGLRGFFHVSPQAQITIEANPGTVTKKKLAEYKSCGVNRLSVGMQTDDDALLKTLGRIHSHEEFLNAYSMARQVGFDDISLDLMFGLPGQTLEGFCNTLHNSIALAPEHLSVYSLKVEKGTPFYEIYGQEEIIGEDTERRMYHAAVRMLKNKGFSHYETSNFAKKGHESRHNLKYWHLDETLGLGLAAHSYFTENGTPVRSRNTTNLDEYYKLTGLRVFPAIEKKNIGASEQVMEAIMLQLRLKEGIRFDDFKNRFNLDFPKLFIKEIEKAVKLRLIHADSKGIRPLLKGFDLQNTLICEFIKKI